MKDPGLRFENMVGNHLLKQVHFLEDTEGREIELRYFKDNEQREVDFVITEDKKPKYHSKKDFLNKDGIRVVDAHKGLSEIIDYFSSRI